MGLYRWVKDWDKGWILQSVWGDESQNHASDFYLEDELINEKKIEEVKRLHLIPFTKEIEDDLKSFHGI